MTEPKLTEQVGGYQVVWDEHKIEARISRLHVHTDGHVTGMLAMTHNNGAGNRRLLPVSQFNFSSEITGTKQAKQLAEKFADLPCEWVEMFDYLREAIQKAALSGSPAVEILADYDAEAPPMLIRPLIYEGHQNIIFGDKGVNKSTLAYALAIFLAEPEHGNPMKLPVNLSKGIHTLVLDWETDERTFKWYLGRLAKGLDAGPVPIFYKHCRLPLAQDIEPIADEIGRTGAKLLIIDSLGAAASGEGGELKGAGAALDFNAALRKLPGVTSLIIGQTAKNTDAAKRTVFGSTYFTYYARNIFELCRGEENQSGILHLGLFHRECNFALKSQPIGVKMTYGEDNTIKLEKEPLSMADFIEKVSVPTRIEAALKREPLSRKDLIEELKQSQVDEKTVDVNLGRMSKAGRIMQGVDKRWALVSKVGGLPI